MLFSKRGVGGTTIAVVVIVVILVVAAGAYLAFYTGAPAPSTTSTSTTNTSLPFGGNLVVGVAASQQGSFAVPGTAMLKGIRTAVVWVDSNGGVVVGGKRYNLTVDAYDDQSQSSNEGPLYTKMITQDNAQFLIAPYGSPDEVAAEPIANQYKVVMIGSSCGSLQLFTSTNAYFLCTIDTGDKYIVSPLEWLHTNHPGDKIAFIYSNDPLSISAIQGATAYAKSVGLNVTYTNAYPPTATDLSSVLEAAKASGATAIIGGGHINDGELLVKQLQQVGWTPHFISLLVAVEQPQFAQALGNLSNGVTGTLFWKETLPFTPSLAAQQGVPWYGPTEAQFTSLYAKVAGGVPYGNDAEGASSILVLAKAIMTANSLNSTLVRQALGSMNIMTFFGGFQISSTGAQQQPPPVLAQWQNGALQIVYPDNLSTAKIIYPYNPSG